MDPLPGCAGSASWQSLRRGHQAFTLVEMMVVIGILLVLLAMLFPVIVMLKESARKQQAHRVVGQIDASLLEYQSEDPTKSLPPQDPDAFIRTDPSGSQLHLIDYLIAMHAEGGLHPLVADQANPGLRVLIDPWQRPYRYVLDAAGAADPTKTVAPTRPDPARTDWNARNLVPYGYVWSLGPPVNGHAGAWTGDPDAIPGSGGAWIYTTSTP